MKTDNTTIQELAVSLGVYPPESPAKEEASARRSETPCSASCPQCHSVDGFWPADYVDNGVGMEKCGPAHCEACGWIETTFDDFLNSLHNAIAVAPPIQDSNEETK